MRMIPTLLLILVLSTNFIYSQQLWFSVPDTLNFTSIEVDDSLTRSMRIRNIDTTALDLTFSIVGADTSEFVVLEGGGQINLPRSVSHWMRIDFRPILPGKKELFIKIESSDTSHTTIFFPIAAEAIDTRQPQLHVAADSMQFGVIKVGDTTGATLRVSNFGSAALDVSDISVIGLDAEEFDIVGGGEPVIMVPGRHITVFVEFIPTSISVKDAFLRFTSNDTAKPVLDLPLIAEGIFAGEPEVRIEMDSLIFPETSIGDTAKQTMKVYNEGTANLFIPGLDILGDAAGDFIITTSDSGFYVVLGQDRLIQVAFIPTEIDWRNATMAIFTDDPNVDSLIVVLAGIGLPGEEDTEPEEEEQPALPLSFELFQNYPNPFNPSTTIKFSLAETSSISLIIYDLLGRNVETLAVGQFDAGLHELIWLPNSNVSAGIYFYRITATASAGQSFTATRRMILIK